MFLLSAVFSVINIQFILQLYYYAMVQTERARRLGLHRQLLIYVQSFAYAFYFIYTKPSALGLIIEGPNRVENKGI